MRAWLITVFVLALTGTVSGCGQKGPLYQDAPSRENAEESAVPERDKDSDQERAEDRSR